MTETTTTDVTGWTYDNQPKTIIVSVTDAASNHGPAVVAEGTNDADGSIIFEDINYEITQMLKGL